MYMKIITKQNRLFGKNTTKILLNNYTEETKNLLASISSSNNMF